MTENIKAKIEEPLKKKAPTIRIKIYASDMLNLKEDNGKAAIDDLGAVVGEGESISEANDELVLRANELGATHITNYQMHAWQNNFVDLFHYLVWGEAVKILH